MQQQQPPVQGISAEKTRPISFNEPMVRALLAGTKTQTRRLVKPQPVPVCPQRMGIFSAAYLPGDFAWLHPTISGVSTVSCKPNGPDGWASEHSPYGQPGDRLWVKETTINVEDYGWAGPIYVESDDGRDAMEFGVGDWDDPDHIEPHNIKLRSSAQMSRAMSRITLEVVSVRVERLQDISDADALAEGSMSWAAEQDTPVRDIPSDEARLVFRQLWESINGVGSWDANPWVWCVSFRRV